MSICTSGLTLLLNDSLVSCLYKRGVQSGICRNIGCINEGFGLGRGKSDQVPPVLLSQLTKLQLVLGTGEKSDPDPDPSGFSSVYVINMGLQLKDQVPNAWLISSPCHLVLFF